MRVMLWCDMEGVAGISVWEQVNGGAPLYEEGRRLYTEEVNAAVRGCKRAGATEIVVVDGHGAGGPWSFKSLIPERLESGAEYVLGYPWARYIAPLEAGCDAALFVGAHAMAGTPDGVLCHTVSSQSWYNARINGTLVGESGIIAAICGDFNTPCVFVSGDAATCREVTELIGPQVVQAPVKIGLGRFSARHLPASDACALIEGRVYSALTRRDWPKPLKFDPPVTFEVELATPDRANDFLGKKGVERIGSRLICSRADSFWQAWDQFWPMGG
ncbi:D-aminopeptidase DppA [Chthonomonas calidirosea]|uniref:M55 family metallopeptidase n=1 Tax=Chthonomonas calidirosea TaxID=454171 RepID=UPI0006DD50B9|nr:M55 family metallopeptidase [Chthonomonas calidirosea]CEK12453.1 D-aminopeptidase DppA [Chthonomonas calidirosea]